MISPLLANVYLHWFERRFHRDDGPGDWAKAKLVRYADDFVVLARYQSARLIDWIEGTLEGRFGLTINREKTRTVKLRSPGARLDFLGFTLRYDRDRFGRDRRYLDVQPSKEARQRAQAKLRELTARWRGLVPIPVMIAEVNRWLRGWEGYFRYGYPSEAFRALNWYVEQRLYRHLRRRSQRPYRVPAGESVHAHLHRLGLRLLGSAHR